MTLSLVLWGFYYFVLYLLIDLFPPLFAAVEKVLNRITINYSEPDGNNTSKIEGKALLGRLTDPKVLKVQCTLLCLEIIIFSLKFGKQENFADLKQKKKIFFGCVAHLCGILAPQPWIEPGPGSESIES